MDIKIIEILSNFEKVTLYWVTINDYNHSVTFHDTYT